MKHTPGPWEADHRQRSFDNDHEHWIVLAPMPDCNREGVVADTLNCDHVLDPDDQRANALLIAAAPDLLAACEVALKLCESNGYGRPAVQDLLRQTIAKAKGE